MHRIAVWLYKIDWALNSVATMREVHSTVSLSQGGGIFFMATVENRRPFAVQKGGGAILGVTFGGAVSAPTLLAPPLGELRHRR